MSKIDPREAERFNQHKILFVIFPSRYCLLPSITLSVVLWFVSQVNILTREGMIHSGSTSRMYSILLLWEVTLVKMKWNESGFRLLLCTNRLNWTEEPHEDGEMSEMTLPSRHRIRNSRAGGLRSCTLPLGTAGNARCNDVSLCKVQIKARAAMPHNLMHYDNFNNLSCRCMNENKYKQLSM